MSQRFESALKKRIDEAIAHTTSDLTVGMAVKDYAQYREYVGRITALKQVITEYFDDVHTELNRE